jgi:hypothetical protein
MFILYNLLFAVHSLINSSIHSSMALQPLVRLWPLLRFHNRNLFTQTLGLLGRVISPSQGHYLHTGQHRHRINAYTDIRASSGIRTHDPSVRANEDSSRLRPRGHCDRLFDLHTYLNFKWKRCHITRAISTALDTNKSH